MLTPPAALLSIVIPAFNEQEVLRMFHKRLSSVLQTLPFAWEAIYVNDGSTDNTLFILQELKKQDEHISIIDLSRNFGKELALTAGLDHAEGEATIIIDADLQDPPELIPLLIKEWQQGFDVVYATRTSRAGETWFKKLTAHYFYRLIAHLSAVPIPRDTGDFRLLSKRALIAVRQLREQHRFMKGLFSWIGYPQKGVPYQRDARFAGHTKWNYWKLWNFALEGITSFSIAPLKWATYLGFLTAFSAFLAAVFIIYKTLIYGESVQGYPSLMVTILFFGGLQLVTLGIIGEYLGRMFDENKERPLYLLKNIERSAYKK